MEGEAESVSTTEESQDKTEVTTLEELVQNTKNAYDFSCRVVNNAHALLENTQASLKKLRQWETELGNVLKEDEEEMGKFQGCFVAMDGFRDKIDAMVTKANVDKEYADLKKVLDVLGETKIATWMRSSDYSLMGGEGVLLDYVDIQEIESLHNKLLEKIESMKNMKGMISQEREKLSEQRDTVHAEISTLFQNQDTGTSSSLSSSENDTANVFELARTRLSDWIEKVAEAIDHQEVVVKALSSGSLGLAGLYDHLLRMEEHQGDDSDDAESLRQLQNFHNRLEEFARNDFQRIPNQKSKAAGAQQQTQTPYADSMESEAKVFYTKLREKVEEMPGKFKAGLKKVADLVDTIKLLAKPFLTVKQSYVNKLKGLVASEVSAMQTISSECKQLVSKCEVLEKEIETSAVEFQKLERFYNQFLKAQVVAKDEVKRRWDALAQIEELARKQQNQINELVQNEIAKRNEFYKTHGCYLPQGLLPALQPQVVPTSFQYVITNPDDAHMLHECVKHFTETGDSSSEQSLKARLDEDRNEKP